MLAIAEPLVIVGLGYLSYRYWEKAKLAQQELALEHAQTLALQAVNKELNAQALTMQESSDLRTDFVQSLTHALRGPIAITRTAVDLLENEENLSDCGKRYLGILKAQAQTAGKLIDDLLESIQLEMGATELELSNIRLTDWLPNLVQAFTPRAASRRQDLVCSVQPGMPPLLTDARKLERAIAELILNALKYSKPVSGEIRVSATYDKDRGSHIIEVSNPGFIHNREKEAIWERFYRIPKSDPTNQGGTGLGLYLVKQIVKKLEGNVSVQVKIAAELVVFRIEL